jgi:hypothetical protein
MKKWFFSSNGKVTSALSFTEATAFLNNHPDAYGWNASFKQWKPANCINEFVDIMPKTMPTPLISQETSDKFRAKKMSLQSKLTSLESSMKQSLNSLVTFEQQIQDYKDLTCNLNDNVKNAIGNIEKKFKTLSSKLTHHKEIIEIAKTEMLEVVEDFDRKMQSNDILMPTCIQNAIQTSIQSSTVHYLNTENVDESLINMAKSAQDKLTVPPNKPDLSKLAKTLKTTKEFNKDIKKTESSETITKVYRGVEYQVQKQL